MSVRRVSRLVFNCCLPDCDRWLGRATWPAANMRQGAACCRCLPESVSVGAMSLARGLQQTDMVASWPSGPGHPASKLFSRRGRMRQRRFSQANFGAPSLRDGWALKPEPPMAFPNELIGLDANFGASISTTGHGVALICRKADDSYRG